MKKLRHAVRNFRTNMVLAFSYRFINIYIFVLKKYHVSTTRFFLNPYFDLRNLENFSSNNINSLTQYTESNITKLVLEKFPVRKATDPHFTRCPRTLFQTPQYEFFFPTGLKNISFSHQLQGVQKNCCPFVWLLWRSCRLS